MPRLPRLPFRGAAWLAFWRTGWWESLILRVAATLRLLRMRRTSPEEVARGAAIGIFFAFAGPPGLQVLPAVAVAVMTRSSVLVAVVFVFFSNPITMPFIYAGALKVGGWITNSPPVGPIPRSAEQFWEMVKDWPREGRFFVNIAAGCLALGSAAAALVYPLAWVGWSRLEARRRHLR